MRAWANVAQLVKMHKLDGSFAAQSAAGLPFLLREGARVALVPPQEDLPRLVTVSFAEETAAGKGVVRFAEITDAQTARALTGSFCLVERSELAVSDVDDVLGIIGWEVRDVREGSLGTVHGIIENPAQELLEVERPEGGMILIPYVDDLILDADRVSRVLSMELPAGLTAL